MIYYDEIFLSIQGESRDTGIPCVFVRLFGCPLRCSYCDTIQSIHNRKGITFDNLIDKVKEYGVKNVCITGGEPLIYDDTLLIADRLSKDGYDVSIETNGCIALADNPDRKYRYIMDIKCPSSNESGKNIFSNLKCLTPKDDVICVIKDREDYEYVKKVLEEHPTRAIIYLSPMFKDDKPLISGELVEWIVEDRLNVRVGVQIHKILEVK